MNNKTIRAFSIILTILLGAGFITEIFVLLEDTLTNMEFLVFFAQTIISMFAGFYMLSGCNKENGAVYYKYFMISFGVLIALSILSIVKAVQLEEIVPLIAMLGILCVLSFGKKLGNAISVVLAAFLTICGAFRCYVGYILNDLPFEDMMLKMGVVLILCLCTLFMVCAKYADKKARGTK